MKIRSLIMTDGNGFFVELEDGELAFDISPNEGSVMFDSEAGRMCLTGKHIHGFEIEPLDRGDNKIVLSFTTEAGESHAILIGHIRDVDSARCWVERVNKLYSEEYRKERKRRFPLNSLSTIPFEKPESKALALIGISNYAEFMACSEERIRGLTDCNVNAILEARQTIVSCWNEF